MKKLIIALGIFAIAGIYGCSGGYVATGSSYPYRGYNNGYYNNGFGYYGPYYPNNYSYRYPNGYYGNRQFYRGGHDRDDFRGGGFHRRGHH